jgi:hypothetical protein
MIENYFLSALKINSKTSELVIPGGHITIDNRIFEQLSRKPKGRSIAKRLLNTKTQERFIIYA